LGGTGRRILEGMGGIRKSYQLGTKKEVFDAESFGLMKGLKKAVRMQTSNTMQITIFCDSQEAIRRIASDHEGPGQAMARAIRKWEKEILNGVSLTYCWVPGHKDVPGNEAADHWAKVAASIRFPSRKLRKEWEIHSLASINRNITERCNKTSREWITRKLEGNKAYRLQRNLGMRRAFKPEGHAGPEESSQKKTTIAKKDSSVFFQLASGHALIGAHLKKFKMRDDDGCWWCNKRTKQTRGHLFGQCKRFAQEYRKLVTTVNDIRKERNLQPRKRWRAYQFFQEEGYERAVIEFLKETGIGYVIG
jgi:ribonuclease HI